MGNAPGGLKKDAVRGWVLPAPLPDDATVLLRMLQEASAVMEAGHGSGAPTFDHGRRLFDQVHAKLQTVTARELGEAHNGLHAATTALKAATWWLAAVTVALGVVKIIKLFVS